MPELLGAQGGYAAAFVGSGEVCQTYCGLRGGYAGKFFGLRGGYAGTFAGLGGGMPELLWAQGRYPGKFGG